VIGVGFWFHTEIFIISHFIGKRSSPKLIVILRPPKDLAVLPFEESVQTKDGSPNAFVLPRPPRDLVLYHCTMQGREYKVLRCAQDDRQKKETVIPRPPRGLVLI
jgi:hypothetical protein